MRSRSKPLGSISYGISKTQILRPLFWLGLFSLGGFTRPLLLLNAEADTRMVFAANVTQPQALASARSRQRQEQERQVRPENYDLQRYPVSDANARHWRNLLWTTAIVEPREPFVAQALTQLLAYTTQPRLSDAQTRTIDMAMQIATQMFLADPNTYASLGSSFRQTLDRSADPQWVAMAFSALMQAGLDRTELLQWRDRIQQRFPKWQQNDNLYTTLRDAEAQLDPSPRPPLKDLLNWQVAPGELQGYVLCRPNRYLLCRLILKDGQGKWVRTGNQLWSVPLLLRSIHHLQWNFVRGQTPQGLYRIEGSTPQPDDAFFRAYGQFSLVNLFVPFESGAKQFIPGEPGSFRRSLPAYQALLPPSWRKDWGLQESYWAGKLGRSLFRIHGSGDATNFFSGKSGYPDSYNWNPTIGCLSALEVYSPTGKLLQADMPGILGKLRSIGGQSFQGYLFVVDLPGSQSQPVSLADVEALVDQ